MRCVFVSIVMACAACGPAEPLAPAAAGEAESPSIIAAFAGDHPLARAQSLDAAGRHDQAVAAAEAVLATDPSLEGLCFDRFTVGGGEIVLGPCAPMTGAAREAFVRERSETLAAAPDVAYAEPNLVVLP